MNLGEKLKALRNAKGLSLKELSEAINKSVSLISDIENGRSNPSLVTLKAIASALSTPLLFFVEDSDNSIFGKAIEDTDFMPIIELLKDFSDWSIEDKKELIHYLKAKNVIRDN